MKRKSYRSVRQHLWEWSEWVEKYIQNKHSLNMEDVMIAVEYTSRRRGIRVFENSSTKHRGQHEVYVQHPNGRWIRIVIVIEKGPTRQSLERVFRIITAHPVSENKIPSPD